MATQFRFQKLEPASASVLAGRQLLDSVGGNQVEISCLVLVKRLLANPVQR